MTMIVRSMTNESITIDSVAVPAWEVQVRAGSGAYDDLSSEMKTAVDRRLVQVDPAPEDFALHAGSDATSVTTLTVGATEYDVTKVLEVTIGGVTGYVPWFATVHAP